ncbi:MAG: hypothetical protein GPJ54_16765 [Candidatus Heimdallarchaeota archaeon]|nr:hypothetical protein [Candidatus Heimdallarchaeota archaeon]
MNALQKILEAQSLLVEKLGSTIKSMTLNKRGKELKVILLSGIAVYIVYNNYDQYSYSIVYTQSKYDRLRYDNFDNRWDVVSRPHHLHPRGSKTAKESSMTGTPSLDIAQVIQILNEE